MSKIEVNAIEPQCGTNLTVGASGDTITFPSGTTVVNNGSQTGFGRTGTVNWVTTKKTTGFTAVSGEGYFCDTAASGAFTLTLPSSPSAGDIVGFKDYNGNFATANLTIGRNSQPINGANASDPVIDTNGASIFLVYVDASQGWVPTQDDSSAIAGLEPYITATGGTVTTCGDYKIHTFTSPGTFCVTSGGSPSGSNTVDYLVVAGGGGAEMAGGGGGGVRFTNSTYTIGCAPAAPRVGGSALSVPANPYAITVGAGGAGTAYPSTCGTRGSNSIFSTITSTGGGGGGKYNGPGSCAPQTPGGSGGGGQSVSAQSGCNQGAGNTPSVAPSQGTPGGTSSDANINAVGSGGGGGMMATGGNASSGPSSCGGNAGAGGAGGGFPSAFGTSGENCGSYYYFSGGGGGGAQKNPAGGPSSAGGIGGGGVGRRGPNSTGESGTANTGGGGGGWGGFPSSACGGSGGSGIVIIRYKFQ